MSFYFHRVLATVATLLFTSWAPAQVAGFQKGDEVALIRDEALLFRNAVLRTGKAGERFTVLAHHEGTQRVFLDAKDKTGKQIAVSVAENALVAAPVDSEALRTEALVAAKAGQYDRAQTAIDRAIRGASTDQNLQQVRSIIVQAKAADAALSQAEVAQKTAKVAAAAKRKSAAVVDRPNRLIPNDTSNQDRANQLRAQADAMELAAKLAMEEARAKATVAKNALLNPEIARSRSNPQDLAAMASTPGEFAKAFAKHPNRFPLTAYTIRLQEKDWAAAGSLLDSAAEIMNERGRTLNWALDSVIPYLVAAQAAAGETGLALKTCSRALKPRHKALALRVLAEWSLRAGKFESALTAAKTIDQEIGKLPARDRRLIEEGNTQDISEAALDLVVQQGIVRSLLVKAFAEAGRFSEAKAVGEIADIDSKVKAECALIKALFIAEAPEAADREAALLKGLTAGGRSFWRYKAFEARASGLAALKKWAASVDALDKGIAELRHAGAGIPDEIVTSATVGLLAQKAKIQRLAGDEALARKALAEALHIAENARDARTLATLSKFGREGTCESLKRLHQTWRDHAESSDAFPGLLDVARAQREINDVAAALHTLTSAASLLARNSAVEISAAELCEELVLCGDFPAAQEMLDKLRDPTELKRLRKTLAVEHAKRGLIKQAVAALQGSEMVDADLDEIATKAAGFLERTELFPALVAE